LELTEKVLQSILAGLQRSLPGWQETIGVSFLPEEEKALYRDLLRERTARLGLG